MPRVAEVWRYPVKSMQGERVASSRVDHAGLEFDRAYALLDVATGKVASAKLPRPWGVLLQMSARIADEESRRAGHPVVELAFGDEAAVITGAGDAAAARTISDWVGREVRIVSAAPEQASFDELWVEDMGSPESMYAPVTGEAEGDGPVLTVPAAQGAPAGTLFDFAALHLVAAPSIRSLSRALGDTDVDVRRFRPNLLIETEDVEAGAGAAGAGGAGAVEAAGAGEYPDNAWARSAFRIGDAVEARGIIATMRCVMVTLAQKDLPGARQVLQALNRHNRVEVPSMGTYPCIGVYARVVQPGTVSEGDEVVVSDR